MRKINNKGIIKRCFYLLFLKGKYLGENCSVYEELKNFIFILFLLFFWEIIWIYYRNYRKCRKWFMNKDEYYSVSCNS